MIINHLSPRKFAEICQYAIEENKKGIYINKCVELALAHFKMEDGKNKWTENAWYYPIYFFINDGYAETEAWIEERLKS